MLLIKPVFLNLIIFKRKTNNKDKMAMGTITSLAHSNTAPKYMPT